MVTVGYIFSVESYPTRNKLLREVFALRQKNIWGLCESQPRVNRKLLTHEKFKITTVQ